MKTAPLDFLLSFVALSALGAGDYLLVRWLAATLTQRTLGPYHVLADGLLFLLFFGLLCALAVRSLLAWRPLLPGTHDMEAPLFTRWKLCSVLYEFGKGSLLPFTTVLVRPLVAALFGARIGKNVALGGTLGDPWLVELGDGAVVGHGSAVVAHAITSGRIVLARTVIGRGATVGVNAVVLPGVEVGEGSVVAAGSVVTLGTRIPAGELWAGAPARKVKALDADDVRG